VNKEWRTACRRLAETSARKVSSSTRDEEYQPFAYRWEHVQQVVQMALILAELTDADVEIVEAAAWLHDVHKGLPQHAHAGADEALRFLPETDFPPDKVAAVAGAIAQHEGLTRPENAPPIVPLEAAILWDADKLTKIGVQALAYTLSSPAVDGLTLVQRHEYMALFVRTVLPNTVHSMNTAPAREFADRRLVKMSDVLDQWEREQRGE
jgi:uncharacterized protein